MQKEIKIGGLHYRLKQVPGAELDGAWADIDNRRQTIRIADDLTGEAARSTLLHEVLEAISYVYELKLSHPVIMTLEHGLHQVLADNPGLLD